MKSLFIKTLVLVILFGTNVFAATSTDLIMGEFNAKRRIERVEIAKDMKKRIENIDAYVPYPKPSEREWVEKEEDAIAKLEGTEAWNDRMLQLYESPEWQQRKLKNFLRDVIKALKCITNKKVKLNTEMICWAIVSERLSNDTILHASIMILKRHNKLPKDIEKKIFLGSEDLGYGHFYKTYATGIIEFIIIPYLKGDIK